MSVTLPRLVDRNAFVVVTAHKPLCDSPKSKSPVFECDNDILEEFDRIGVTTTIGADNHCSAYNEGKFIAGSGGGLITLVLGGIGLMIPSTHTCLWFIKMVSSTLYSTISRPGLKYHHIS